MDKKRKPTYIGLKGPKWKKHLILMAPLAPCPPLAPPVPQHLTEALLLPPSCTLMRSGHLDFIPWRNRSQTAINRSLSLIYRSVSTKNRQRHRFMDRADSRGLCHNTGQRRRKLVPLGRFTSPRDRLIGT
jgi:hypothetical protein